MILNVFSQEGHIFCVLLFFSEHLPVPLASFCLFFISNKLLYTRSALFTLECLQDKCCSD